MSQQPSTSSLLSNGTRSVSCEPFFHLKIDNFLPSGQYQALLASFPGLEWFPEIIEGNKHRLNSRTAPDTFEQFCRAQPVWAEFFALLSEEQFLTDLYNSVREPLGKVRGVFGSRPWRTPSSRSMSFFRRALSQPVKVTFELSRLKDGGFVPPHTDAPEKLVTMMFYFPAPDWRESYGGGTVFYRTKTQRLNQNWSNYRVPFEELQTVSVNQFIPNRLCIFIKSKNSYHGLPAVTCPAGMSRNSLNINIFRKKPKRFRRLFQLREHLVQWLELRWHKAENTLGSSGQY